MADSGGKSKVGATPGKLVLIAVLAVVFVSVLLLQFTASEDPPAPQANAEESSGSDTRSTENGTSVPTSPPDNGDVPKQARQRPKIALEEVLRHDPFAVPASLLPPPTKPSSASTVREVPDQARQQELQRQREQALATVRAQGIQMVFVGKAGQAAIIGDRRIRVGDVLEGFRVTHIDSDGVTLSEQE